MQRCSFSDFIEEMSALKKGGAIRVTNFFLDSRETEDLLKNSRCQCIQGPDVFFLLKPWHNQSFDLFYFCRTLSSLMASVGLLPSSLSIRVSVIGKDPLAGELADTFVAAGFELHKKLLRMRCEPTKKSLKKALAIFAEPYKSNFGFATPDEAEQILDMLAHDFDPVGDNLPLLSEVREAAAKNWIPVLRLDGKVATFHYFTLRQNILNGLYDVTREEYRGGMGLFPALKYYTDEAVPAAYPDIKRAYGWRDAKNAKLVKNAKTMNQLYDGVVIYNLFREATGQVL